jgi:peptidoglycan/xylan/chitin deacetylase (PgdA/CDA1 family)
VTRVLRLSAALLLLATGFFALYEVIEAPSTQVFGHTLVHGAGHEVALTFDDGPNALTTPAVLDALERDHVHAPSFAMHRWCAAWCVMATRSAITPKRTRTSTFY